LGRREAERYLIHVDGKLGGFVFSRSGTYFSGDDAKQISEFFILQKYRRQGVGKTVSVRRFDRFQGTWEVAVMDNNKRTQNFWRSVISGYTDRRYEEFSAHHGTVNFVVFRFSGSLG
jgi:predicted acetyltransferase